MPGAKIANHMWAFQVTILGGSCRDGRVSGRDLVRDFTLRMLKGKGKTRLAGLLVASCCCLCSTSMPMTKYTSSPANSSGGSLADPLARGTRSRHVHCELCGLLMRRLGEAAISDERFQHTRVSGCFGWWIAASVCVRVRRRVAGLARHCACAHASAGRDSGARGEERVRDRGSCPAWADKQNTRVSKNEKNTRRATKLASCSYLPDALRLGHGQAFQLPRLLCSLVALARLFTHAYAHATPLYACHAMYARLRTRSSKRHLKTAGSHARQALTLFQGQFAHFHVFNTGMPGKELDDGV